MEVNKIYSQFFHTLETDHLALSVSDEDYARNASRALNWISTMMLPKLTLKCAVF